ncbi:MAG: MATE family efflux transporter [Clostridia bacterium]|nr:MATE family efflux transporter [Clostridia bacterium]
MQTIKHAPATEGPLFTKMILFTIPIMLTGILQLLYNSADSVIVGRFSGDPNALGAVGCTTSATGLLINMLMGLGAGTGVLVSQFFGAKNDSGVSRVVHTSLAAGLIGGVFMFALGEFISEPLLNLLGTDPVLMPSALLYTRIIFIGVPASAIFNFGAAIVRSIGDSKTPLVILASTGLVNIAFNLFFVVGCGMSVAGVAIATIISQYVSAAWIIIVLKRAQGAHRFYFSKARIDAPILGRMLKIAIPSAIQSSLFSISNMILQTSINTFPTDAISGAAIGSTIDGFTYITLNSFYHTTLTFAGQNYGACKFERSKKVVLYSLIQATVIGLALGSLMTVFIEPIASIFVDPGAANTAAVIAAAKERAVIVLIPYVLCGYMETFTGFLRGWGYSLLPMLSCIFCICVVRVLWAKLVFPLPLFNTLSGLFLIYPITWALATLFQFGMMLFVSRKKRIERLVSNTAYEKK